MSRIQIDLCSALAFMVVLAWTIGCPGEQGSGVVDEPGEQGSGVVGEQSDCVPFVALVSAADLAEELGKSELWVVSSYRINVWSKTSHNGKGSAVGKIIPGSRARLLDEDEDDYRIKSPLDGSEGWIGQIQVERIVMQNPETNRICEP